VSAWSTSLIRQIHIYQKTIDPMKSKSRIISLFGSTLVLCYAAAQAAPVTLSVNDGFGASSFASAGTSQQETATVVGTITSGGNLLVTVTSANVVGSPLVFNVPVLLGDVANTVATNIRAALSGNAAITAQFSVGGTNAAVLLTGISTPIATTDATLNIAIANGTAAAGLTAAPTSANTRGATRAWSDGFAPKAGNAYFTGSNLLRTSGTATFGGDEAVSKRVEMTVLENGSCVTVDVIAVALNLAVAKILAAALHANGVLPT
jgi:hypothetical protein